MAVAEAPPHGAEVLAVPRFSPPFIIEVVKVPEPPSVLRAEIVTDPETLPRLVVWSPVPDNERYPKVPLTSAAQLPG